MSLNALAVRGEDGMPLRYEGVCLDVTSRKMAEEDLKKSEQRFRDISYSMADWIWELDEKGIYVYCSERVEDVLGYTPLEVVGKRPFDFWAPEELSRVKEVFLPLWEERRPVKDVEGWHVRKDGSCVCIRTSGVPVVDEQGVFRGYRGVDSDITERKEAEKALRESEEKFRALFEKSKDPILLMDGETFMDCNEAALKLIRASRKEQIIGRGPTDFSPVRQPDGRLSSEKSHEMVALTLKQGVNQFEWKRRTLDGQERWVEVSHTVIPIQGRDVIYTVWRDISVRKEALARLGESEERYRVAVESSGDGVALDRGGKRIYVNKRFLDMFGYERPEEVVGKELGLVIHPDDREMVTGHANRRERGEAAPSRHEFRGIRKDGTVIHIEVSSTRITYQGEPVVLAFLRDVSERKRAEALLRESEERYRVAVENSNDAVVLVRGKELLYGNRRFLDLFGYESFEEALEVEDRFLRVHPDDRAMIAEYAQRRQKGEPTPSRYECKVIRKNGAVLFVEASVSDVTYLGAFTQLTFLRDITDRKLAEKRQEMANRALEMLNSPDEIGSVTRSILALIREHMGIEAVGLRTSTDDDFPYVETNGFPDRFIEAENVLCARDDQGEIIRDGLGKPCLEGICGVVISGRTDPSLPYFTEGGSFWTNGMVKLAPSLAETDHRGLVRGRCAREGYQSVALIPLRSGKEVVGLLQLNDRLSDRFNLALVQFLEGIAGSIGIALSRKEAGDRLFASEAKYRSIFENAVEGIYQTTPAGRLIRVNPALTRMHGYESPEGMVREASNAEALYVNREDRLRYLNLLEKDGVVRGFEVEQNRKDGSTFWASLSGHAVKDGNGNLLLYEGTVEDVTERKKLEDQLRHSQKMEAVGTLAGGVAHDFNNILTVLIGCGDLLRMKMREDEPLRLYVDQILASAEKAANLTQSLLAFSRKQQIKLKPLNLYDAVKGTGKLLERVLSEDIQLKIAQTHQETVIMADPTQIEQILLNLATNARDAMPRGGLLSIETGVATLDNEFIRTHGYGERGKYALLSVSDTGIGMDETTKEHIFEPFFTTKEVGKGTGLGLSTVYGIVKQHNGYITVSSRRHQGTTLRIYFPLAVGRKAPEAPLSQKMERGSETILVAEDDSAVRTLTTDILNTYGYATLEATDGQHAVEVFAERKEDIDLVVLDVVMPRKNGREAFEELKKIRPAVKVLFVSGYTGDAIIDKGVQSERIDFIQKPLSPNDLLRKVREILER